MEHKSNKNNHTINLIVYTGYVRSKVVNIKMPEKMKEDIHVLAKSQGLTVSEMIRKDIYEKYHSEIARMNEQEPEHFTASKFW